MAACHALASASASAATPSRPRCCLLNDKRKDISGPRRFFTFVKRLSSEKQRIKKINNNKANAKNAAPSPKKKEAPARWGDGTKETQKMEKKKSESKMCHAKDLKFWSAHLSSCFYFGARA